MSDIAKMIAIAKRFGGGGSGPTEVVILPETEFPGGTAETQIPITTPLSATPTAGATAKVTYNGKDYDCPIVFINDNGYDGYVMGNIDEIGVSAAGGNPDAPFAISLVPSGLGGGVYGVILSLEDVPSITLSIVQVGAASGGESAGGVVMATATVQEDGTVTSIDKTYNELLSAYEAGKVVMVKVPTPMAAYVMPLVSYVSIANYMVFGINIDTEGITLKAALMYNADGSAVFFV